MQLVAEKTIFDFTNFDSAKSSGQKYLSNIANAKYKAQREVHPLKLKSQMCSLMLLSNLAQPEWMSIPCNEKILLDVICTHKRPTNTVGNSDMNLGRIQDENECLQGEILKGRMCYRFMWYTRHNHKGNSIEEQCEERKMKPVIADSKNEFGFLFDAITSPVLSPDGTTNIFIKMFPKSFNTSQNVSGFISCRSKKWKRMVGINLFQCQDMSYISFMYVQDGVSDCPSKGKEDEQFCSLIDSKDGICAQLFFMDVAGNYFRYSDVAAKKIAEEKQNITYFQCNNSIHIVQTMVEDLVADCGHQADDEKQLKLLLKSKRTDACINPEQLPCLMGHTKCFNISQICIYQFDEFSHLVPCRNGAHLQHCAPFECNRMFKCPAHYCIPWSYVCDGKWDCPSGYDELFRTICSDSVVCKHRYKCRKTNFKCVHLGDTCDGQNDCPLGDDEYLCDLKNIQSCADGCYCLAFAISCTDTIFSPSFGNSPFRSITLNNCIISSLYIFFLWFHNAMFLTLKSSEIIELPDGILPEKIIWIDFTHNLFRTINKNDFRRKDKLKVILLDHNKIVFLEIGSFYDLPELAFVTLSHNPLINFPSNLFSESINFKLLSVINVSFVEGNVRVMNQAPDIILTTDFYFCCLVASTAKCAGKTKWSKHILCSELLPGKALKFCFLTVSIIGLLLALSSILLHMFFLNHTLNPVFSRTVILVNLNDSFCLAYLMIIWVADHENTYALEAERWKTSIMCFVAFNLILCFSILSQCLVYFLAFSRLMVVIHPLDTEFKSTKFALKCLGLMCFCVISFSTVITLLIQFVHQSLPSGTCSPFINPTEKEMILTIILWFIAASQSLTSITIIVIYIILVLTLQQSQKSVQSSKTDENSNTAMVIQLVVISMSVVTCWFPTNIVFVSAFLLPHYPYELVIWVTASTLPINSLISPIVLLTMAVRKYFSQKSHIEKKLQT